MIAAVSAQGPRPATSRLSSRRDRNGLEQLVHEHLVHSGYASLRNIECHCSEGTARLTGQLPSYYLKQTAQEIVRRIDGIDRIYNQLEVTQTEGATA